MTCIRCHEREAEGLVCGECLAEGAKRLDGATSQPAPNSSQVRSSMAQIIGPGHRTGQSERAIATPAPTPDRGAGSQPGAAVMVLVVPMPPSLTNSRKGRSRHWRALEREKERYWEQLDERQRAGLIPPPPAAPLERATVSSVMYLGGAMDDDNAMARHKWAMDWIKTRGYVRDDRRSVLRWAGLPEQIVKRGQEYRIELTLRAMSETAGAA